MKKFIRSASPLIPPVYTEEEIHFNEWLAGFICGDGYFTVEGNYCRLEIPQASWNLHLLELLKSQFGGNIHKVPKKLNTYRYDLTNEEGSLVKLAHAINGNLRGFSRKKQFLNLVEVYNIVYIETKTLTLNNAYTTGLFDTDGCISTQFKEHKKLDIKITSKYKSDLEDLLILFNGNITKRSKEETFDWKIGAKADILFIRDYLLKFPPKSNKKIRVDLIEEYYELKDKQAYKVASEFHPVWMIMIEKWYNNGNDQFRDGCTLTPYKEKEKNKAKEEQ